MEPIVEPASAGTQPVAAPVEPSKEGTQTDAEREQAELSRKAQQFGESRKAFASSLVELSKESETAKQRLLELAKNDYEKEYLNEKFPGVLESLQPKEDTLKVDAPKDETQAKVDVLFTERQMERQSSLKQVKSNIGITQDQEAAFDEWVALYEGKEVGGKALSFKDAVELAARQLTPNVQASSIWRGDVNKRPEDSKDKVDVGLSEERIRANSRWTKAKSAEDFEPLVSELREKGSYTIKL